MISINECFSTNQSDDIKINIMFNLFNLML